MSAEYGRTMESGFKILKKRLPLSLCHLLREEIFNILESAKKPEHLSIFTTKDDLERDQYFYDSYNKISLFFEEAAVEHGQLKYDVETSVNKIGHALHSENKIFREFSFSSLGKNLMKEFGYEEVDIVQSMVIFKNSKFGGEVMPHQDQTYLYSSPDTIKGIWIPLEKATQENGCLWALPFDGKPLLKERFMRRDDKTEIIKENQVHWPEEEFIPLELDPGDVLLFDGLLPHKSFENTSSRSRLAYVIHIKDKNSEYAKENWNYSDQLMRVALDD
jgi:phytanoyl-CoA hydroxylase